MKKLSKKQLIEKFEELEKELNYFKKDLSRLYKIVHKPSVEILQCVFDIGFFKPMLTLSYDKFIILSDKDSEDILNLRLQEVIEENFILQEYYLRISQPTIDGYEYSYYVLPEKYKKKYVNKKEKN